MILVFGSINIDLVARVAAIPRPGETVLAPSYERHFGGKGANQAVAAARLARPGAVAMAACVGADAFGAEAIANLEAEGVDARAVRKSDKPTGCAFIAVDAKAENAITVASGANLDLVAADAPALNGESLLVLQMETPLAQSLTLAAGARAAGARVVWNAAPIPPDLGREGAAAIAAASDVLIVNEGEAEDLLKALGAERGDLAALIAAGTKACVVTSGARGALAVTGAGRVEAPAPAIQPVDTTGAGDTFVGALAAALEEGAPLPAALAFAVRAGAAACMGFGAQSAMPRRGEV